MKVTDEETKENAWKEFVVSEGLFEEERAGKEQERKRIRQRGGKKRQGEHLHRVLKPAFIYIR